MEVVFTDGESGNVMLDGINPIVRVQEQAEGLGSPGRVRVWRNT